MEWEESEKKTDEVEIRLRVHERNLEARGGRRRQRGASRCKKSPARTTATTLMSAQNTVSRTSIS